MYVISVLVNQSATAIILTVYEFRFLWYINHCSIANITQFFNPDMLINKPRCYVCF